MPNLVGSRQEVGDAQKNLKWKGYPQKEKGWTPKDIATPKFEGRIEELIGYVFDQSGLNKLEIFNRAIKEITEYVDQEINPLTGKVLRNLKVPIIRNTKNLDLDQGESTMDNFHKDIFQEEIK